MVLGGTVTKSTAVPKPTITKKRPIRPLASRKPLNQQETTLKVQSDANEVIIPMKAINIQPIIPVKDVPTTIKPIELKPLTSAPIQQVKLSRPPRAPKPAPKVSAKGSIKIERVAGGKFYTLFVYRNPSLNKDEVLFSNRDWIKFISSKTNYEFKLIKRYLNGRTEPPEIEDLIYNEMTEENIGAIEIAINPDFDASAKLIELIDILVPINDIVMGKIEEFDLVKYEYELATTTIDPELLTDLITWLNTLPDSYDTCGDGSIGESVETIFRIKSRLERKKPIHYKHIAPLLKLCDIE